MRTIHKAWWSVFLLGLGGVLLSNVPARAGDKKTTEEKKQIGKEDDPKKTGPASIFKGKATTLAWKDGKVSYDGELTSENPLAQERYFKLFAIQLEAGKTYRIDLKSRDDPKFDSYLFLEDADGKELAYNDDGGDGLNSRILYKISRPGQYRLIATTYPAKQTGKFTLEVSSQESTRIFKGKATTLAWKDGQVSYDGELTSEDPLAQERYFKLFTIQLAAGKTYRIDMKSRDDPKFDSYLFLEDADGKELAYNDDGGGGLNSRILYKISKTGQHRLIATTYPTKQTGKFTLEVSPLPSAIEVVVDEKALNEAVRKLFEQKGFAPQMIPSGPFTLKEFDPLLLQALWAQVRPDLESLYQRMLKLEGRPDLRLRFLNVDDPTWKKLQRLRVVLRDPGNETMRKSLLATLSLPERSFEATGISKQQQTAKVYITVDARKQTKAMDLRAIKEGFEAELGAKKSPFRGLKLTPLEEKLLQKNAGVQLFSRWVFLREVEEPRPQFYYWRVRILLEKTAAEGGDQLETWVFQTVAEIGRSTRKNEQVALIQDTDMAADFGEWLAGTLQKPPQKSGTYEREESPRIVQVRLAYPKDGKPGYYTDPQKEGTGERFIQESPLAQTANHMFRACYKRLLQETGWTLK